MNTPRLSSLPKIALTAALVALGLFATSDAAMAQTSPMGNVVCAIIGIVYGNLGRGIAVLSVIILGIGAMIGKVSWGLAMTISVGIGTVFGAVPLTAYLMTADGTAPICYGIAGIQ